MKWPQLESFGFDKERFLWAHLCYFSLCVYEQERVYRSGLGVIFIVGLIIFFDWVGDNKYAEVLILGS